SRATRKNNVERQSCRWHRSGSGIERHLAQPGCRKARCCLAATHAVVNRCRGRLRFEANKSGSSCREGDRQRQDGRSLLGSLIAGLPVFLLAPPRTLSPRDLFRSTNSKKGPIAREASDQALDEPPN